MTTEQQLAAQWRKMRIIATALLITVFILAIVAALLEPYYPWLRFVRGFAEAATVGALADWFAVVALFRHPLGIPFPHTAILPRNKNQLAESFGRFLETKFLSPEVIQQRIQHLNLLRRFAQLLDRHRQTVVVYTVSVVQQLLAHLDPQQWLSQLMRHFRPLIATGNLARGLGKAVDLLLQHRLDTVILDELLNFLTHWIQNHRSTLGEFLDSKIPWYIPRPFRTNLADHLIDRLERFIDEVRRDPHHPFREQFRSFGEDIAQQLQHVPEYEEKIRSILQQLLEQPEVHQAIERLLDQINTTLYHWITDSPQQFSAVVETLLQKLIIVLQEDDAVNVAMNAAFQRLLLHWIEEHRSTFRSFIVSVVQQWDEQQLVRNIELYVGRDLQFIRLNGTLVGGIIGLGLTGLLEILR